MAVAPRTPPKKRDWSWRSQAFRGLLYQIVAVVLIGGVAWFLAHNTAENMRIRGIQGGFDFLKSPAGSTSANRCFTSIPTILTGRRS